MGSLEFLHNDLMRIGEYQSLEVVRNSPHGFFLSDGENDVLLPNNQTPQGIELGQRIGVFVYTDSEDRPVATLQQPIATVGEFALLEVVSVSESGAFLDWGLAKDLFCPFSEQQRDLTAGDRILVRIYLDQVSGRVVGTSKLSKFLRPTGEGLTVGEPIKIMVAACHRDSLSVIINQHIRGTLFRDEWHERLRVGDVRSAYVKDIREADGKVAVSFRPQGYVAVIGESDRILKALKVQGGFLPVNDKSSPEEIHRKFGLSKSAFKKLIGTLYRQGVIEIESHGIRLRTPK